MKISQQIRYVQTALYELNKISMSSNGKRKWRFFPKEKIKILDCFRKSRMSYQAFSKSIGMPLSTLYHFSNQYQGNCVNKIKNSLDGRFKSLEDPMNKKSNMIAESPEKITKVILLPNNSFEVTEKRIVQYGTEEHTKLLRQFASKLNSKSSIVNLI